jgi:hypothetical protein
MMSTKLRVFSIISGACLALTIPATAFACGGGEGKGKNHEARFLGEEAVTVLVGDRAGAGRAGR